ncbi:MAG: phosphate ABC transporter substrate-binding protein, partial [Pseudomonadota bacterium]
MPRLASLAMYDTPSASAAFWSAIADRLRQRGIAAPDRLSELPAEIVWRDPDLLFAQTCGYPLTSALAGLVRLVAVPVYAAEGCEGPTYRSAIVVHHDDPATDLADCAGYLPAVNYRASQSGQNALRAAVAPLARGGPFLAPGL